MNDMTVAQLTAKRWFRRTWIVQCGDAIHTIDYSGWGLNTERVYLDGVEVVRRGASSLRLRAMSHGYRFPVDDGHTAALSVTVPWWCELLPVSDLSFARLEVDGETVYEEGTAPTFELRWTTAPCGFPVIHPGRSELH